MKSLSSWLLAIFMFMFWAFRLIVAFQAQYEKDFAGFFAFNLTIEIILLFLVILCIILVLRRNVLGGIIYFASYIYYFGGYILSDILPKLTTGEELRMIELQNAMASGIGVILAICVLLDLIIAKVRKRDPKDKKTDWFFKNEQYDRQYDERADKNQYRSY